MSDLARALAELQADPPHIGKTAEAQYGKYADLPTVTKALAPPLAALGLLWQTWPDLTDAGFALRWKLTHLESGEFLAGSYPIHATDPQKQGSEITYARRYALVTVTGVTPEGDDDDGQAASGATERPARTRAKIPGAEHERLREGTARGRVDGSERIRGPVPPDDDPWAGHAEPAEKQPGSITPEQLSRMQIAFRNTGVDDRDVRLGMVAQIIGRRPESSKDLSYEEAAAVINSLRGGS